MAAEDIENKVRKMSSQKPENGKDLQQLQEAQNQLVQINAERQGNLQTARLENNANVTNNETMSQAVEMASLGGLGGASVQQQVQAMNPQTQAVLGKYGLGQPRVQRSSSRSVQVTPQKITINNNTTNTTTNNVAVPAANIGGPVQGRTLAVKQDESQARFKTWISNAFAKQNQQAAVREKEYQRREWSLTRSTNKLMKHLSDLGKSVSERLNPQKLASSVGNQFKTILFLFGTTFLAKNWEKVISIGASIERFLFGEVTSRDENGKVVSRGRSEFSKMLISLFGGDPNSNKASIGESLMKFFWNPDYKGGSESGAGAFQLLLLKVKHFFQEGAEAVKNLELPKLSRNDVIGSLRDVLGYLGNVITTLFTGAEGLKKSMTSDLKKTGNDAQFGVGSDGKKKSWARDEGFWESRKFDRTLSAGELKEINGVGYGKGGVNYGDFASERNNINTLKAIDMDSSGNLTGTVGSTIRQSAAISGMLRDKDSVNSVGVLRGLRNLEKAVKDNKTTYGDNARGVAVKDRSFFTDLGLTSKEITELVRSGDIKLNKYKYVIDTKTPEELDEEARAKGGSIEYKVANAAARGAVDQFFGTNKMIGTIVGMAGGAVLCMLPGGQIAGIPLLASGAVGGAVGGTIGNLLGQSLDSPIVQGALEFAKAKLIPDGVPLHMIRMVPASDPRPGLYYNSNDGTLSDKKKTRGRHTAEESIVEKYTLTENSLNKIKEKLGLRSLGADGKVIRDLPFDETNMESLSIIQDYAKGYQLALHGKTSDNFDFDASKISKAVSRVDKLRAENQAEFDKALKGSKPYQSYKYVSEGVGSVVDSVKGHFSQIRKPEQITEEQQKERTIKVIDFAMNELGMTKEQAAGLAGNLIRESGLVTTAVNSSPDAATGLAQWLGPRKRAFEHTLTEEDKEAGWKEYTGPGSGKPLANASFEDQLQYIKWELTEGKHINGLKKIKEAETAEHAAINAFGYYEFSAGPEKAVAAMNKHGQNGEKSLRQGIEFAGDALLTYNSIKGSNNLEDVKVDPTTYMAESSTVTPDNYVEERKPESNYLSQLVLDDKSYNPEFSMSSFNSPLLASTSFTTPISATKVPTVDTPMISAKTIGKEITSANNDSATISDILKTANLLNDNIKLLQQGQLAQVQATTSIASGLGNMTITINSGGDKKIPTAGWTKEPYA